MSSKGEIQATAILTIVQAGIRQVINNNLIARVDKIQELIALNNEIDRMRKSWSPNERVSDFVKTLKHIANWSEEISGFRDNVQNYTNVMLYIGLLAAEDLHNKLNNNARKNQVQKVIDDVRKLTEFKDPTGTSFISMEQADKLLKDYYKQIGFVPN